jgi:hypothetical protein
MMCVVELDMLMGIKRAVKLFKGVKETMCSVGN